MEAAENLEVALNMEIAEAGGYVVKGKEGVVGTQRADGYPDFFTHDEEPSGTTIFDARNGFNKLSRLKMMWTVCHR